MNNGESGDPPCEKSKVSLLRLACLGVAMLVCAAILSAWFRPGRIGIDHEDDFMSRIIDTRAGNPNISVTAFRAPDPRGVVLWIEGGAYIPASASLE